MAAAILFGLAAVAGLVAGPLAEGATPADFGLVSHRAFYALRLKSAAPGSSLGHVQGGMFVEWIEGCEGWTSSQRLQLRFVEMGKPPTEFDSRFASFETFDGLGYRFSVQNLRNGETEKELNGRARLEGEGRAGEAEFFGRTPVKIALPAGTVFPLRHLVALLEAAKAGQRIVPRVVFDGTSEEGPFEVNAVIGPLRPAAPMGPALPESVSQPYWPMRLAFFDLADESMVPFYELSVDLMPNGVARSFLLDYGDSVIAAELERVEPLPRPSC